jgi:hypothetical protein
LVGAGVLRLLDNPRAGARRAAAGRILERKQVGLNKLFLNSRFLKLLTQESNDYKRLPAT